MTPRWNWTSRSLRVKSLRILLFMLETAPKHSNGLRSPHLIGWWAMVRGKGVIFRWMLVDTLYLFEPGYSQKTYILPIVRFYTQKISSIRTFQTKILSMSIYTCLWNLMILGLQFCRNGPLLPFGITSSIKRNGRVRTVFISSLHNTYYTSSHYAQCHELH